jgi:hypothetical protein
MTRDEFWTIIDYSKTQFLHDTHQQSLAEILRQLEPQELIDFNKIYHQLHAKAYTFNLWGAAYLINGGCSDDCFHYFRSWLISQGKDIFEASLLNPEYLAELELIEQPEFEEFEYVVLEVYEELTSEEMPLIETTNFGECLGKKWEEEQLKTRFPKLAQKYG